MFSTKQGNPHRKCLTVGCGVMAVLTAITLSIVLIVTLVGERYPENQNPPGFFIIKIIYFCKINLKDFRCFT